MSLLMPDTPNSPDCLPSSFSSASASRALVAHQVDQHARIDLTTARAHHHPPPPPPSSAVKPIVVETLAPASMPHRLTPLPRCATMTFPAAVWTSKVPGRSRAIWA